MQQIPSCKIKCDSASGAKKGQKLNSSVNTLGCISEPFSIVAETKFFSFGYFSFNNTLPREISPMPAPSEKLFLTDF